MARRRTMVPGVSRVWRMALLPAAPGVYCAAQTLATDGCFTEAPRDIGNGHLSRFGYQVSVRAIADWLEATKQLEQP